MRTIYKYKLDVDDTQSLTMPVGSEVLCVQVQNSTVCLWALIDESIVAEEVTIVIVGTGHPVPTNPMKYIGSFQLVDGNFVGHVFVVKKNLSEK